ncbi:MAG: hypothetical protein HVK41_06480 [Pelagibacteraceae bacterium]|nr:hypothetical protein [Pelagibacteraceae bacterium]MDP6784924.1 hypothetical protein [Alphaproteobacteria bacterium]
MLEKLLIICCYFDYHPRTRLVDVKIGFGPSGKIEKVECKICKKVYIRDKKTINPTIILLIILLFVIVMLLL